MFYIKLLLICYVMNYLSFIEMPQTDKNYAEVAHVSFYFFKVKSNFLGLLSAIRVIEHANKVLWTRPGTSSKRAHWKQGDLVH